MCLPINIYPGITLYEKVVDKNREETEMSFTTYDYTLGIGTITFNDKPFGPVTYTFDQLGTTIYDPLQKYEQERAEASISDDGGALL